tara:strand:+ start:58 stop:813 length:756 start_codon:yes stop_codon:yes gene_type:complete
MTSTIKANIVTASTTNADLSLDGNGTGVVDLGAGYKVGGTVDPLSGVAPGTSGNLLTSNGSAWTSAVAAGGGSTGMQSQQVFTTSGTWTKPTDVTKVRVIVTGGGGSSYGTGSYTGSGGAGGTAIKIIDVTAISSVAVTVGAAGSPTGGTSSFGSHCSATGGGQSNGNTGGGGGTASGGDMNLQGSGGGRGYNSVYVHYQGGSSYWGGSGTGGAAGTGTQTCVGAAGSGAGGCSDAVKVGGVGLVLVEEIK